MSEIPEWAEVKRMPLEPGDVILVECSRRITTEQAEEIKRQINAVLPEHKVMILPPEMKIALLADGWPVPKDVL